MPSASGTDPIDSSGTGPGTVHEMTASSVFFMALGWDGLRGAFFLTSSISAPSCCRTLRPSVSRTLGNQSCSSSSMWCRTLSINTVVLARTGHPTVLVAWPLEAALAIALG
jgi:hypothetical protein